METKGEEGKERRKVILSEEEEKDRGRGERWGEMNRLATGEAEKRNEIGSGTGRKGKGRQD